jgi:uncharacterized protein YecE (DUF72 family)
MGLFTKDIETMDDLLLHGLQDIYYAENQIVKSLPKLIEKATNRDLTKGLRDHLEETTRLHGAPRMYYSAYDCAFLTRLDAAIRRRATQEVWCIFDNTVSGAATANALAMQTRLAGIV